MKFARIGRVQIFAVVIGFTDGILTALTLASGHLIHGSRPTANLAFRVATGSAICGVFVFFTAEYARLRGDLLHAEKQLNLVARGVFATVHLGKQIRKEALSAALLSSAANFIGAFFPLLVGVLMPGASYLGLLPPLLALGLLGAVLAHTIHGRYFLWIASLAIAGLVFSFIGVLLHIA